MRKIIVSSMMILVVMASMATAVTRHVGPGQTYATIDAAYAAAATSDIIEIHAGVYTSFPDMSANETDKEALTFRASGDDTVVIALPDYVYYRWQYGYRFENLIFDATGITSYGTFYIRDRVHSTIFSNCIFYGSTQAGVYLYGGGEAVSNMLFDNCTFYGGAADGIRIANAVTATVKDCLFVNNAGSGVSATANAVPVEYCAFWNNGSVPAAGAAALGAHPVTNAQPTFVSDTISYVDPNHLGDTLKLTYDAPLRLRKGSSEGSFIGAALEEPIPAACGDPGTVYAASDIAGPAGSGLAYRDCMVDLFDLRAMADHWLDCLHPQDCPQ